MSSPPESDREYAYFRAIGTGNTRAVEISMDLKRTEHWNVGDEFERKNKIFKRRSSCWKLESGYDDTNRLELHIEALLNKLTPKSNILNKIQSEYKLQIVCVSFAYQSFSFELPFEMQKTATNLGIGFWFDSYSFGDHHDEIVELREQLNGVEKKN